MSQNILIPKAQFFKTQINGLNCNFGLDVVRALSIVCIFLAHTNNYGGAFTNIYSYIRCLPIIMQELFFCLSGFLVGNQIIKNIKQENSFRGLLNFYKNRWIRTIPFYFIFLFVNYIIFYTFITHISLTSYTVLLSHLYFIQFSMLNIYAPHNLLECSLFSIVYLIVVVVFSTLFFNYIERPILLRRK